MTAQRERDVLATVMLSAAPLAALLGGCAAEWFDVGALRYPLLLMVLAGVTVTYYANDRLSLSNDAGASPRSAVETMIRAVALGILTWALAETVYVVLHIAQREPFEAERFGPQWSQALGLIAAHGVFLGAPTGVVAGGLLLLREKMRPSTR